MFDYSEEGFVLYMVFNVYSDANSLCLQFKHGSMLLQWIYLFGGEMVEKDVQRPSLDGNNQTTGDQFSDTTIDFLAATMN